MADLKDDMSNDKLIYINNKQVLKTFDKRNFWK